MESTPGAHGSTPSRTPANGSVLTSPASLPTPKFDRIPQSLSTKKDRQTPRFRVPPRPPAKTAPPVSRVFRRRGPDGVEQPVFSNLYQPTAQTVTFLASPDGSLTGSPLPKSKVYDNTKKASYFEQAFEVVKLIGSGFFGTVYSVRSKEDGQLYAIKIMKDKYRGQADRKRKMDEVRTLELLLPHPNCVHFYQSWEENGRLYQQFELCETSLADLAEDKHDVGEDFVWACLVDLLQALQHLHDHSLLHMDIKPENIFIGRDGVCKLGDFGLVIDLKDASTLSKHTGGGDAKYIASEILDGKYTKAADVFSLGLTILELACDLDLPSSGAMWHKLRDSGPDSSLIPKLSPELRRIIQLMMIKDFEKRPTVAQVLNLPIIKKAKARRARQLFLNSLVESASSFVAPVGALIYFYLALYLLAPMSRWWERVKSTRPISWFWRQKAKSDADSPEQWPLEEKQTTLRSSFSSDDSDGDGPSLSSSRHSELARPLPTDSSSSPKSTTQRDLQHPNVARFMLERARRDEALPSPIRSPHSSRGPRREDDPAMTQSTPSGLRFRSKRTFVKDLVRQEGVVLAKAITPPRRLDFDDYCHSHNLEDTPVDGREDGAEESDSSSASTKIRPVSLAAKFDYFSDDDKE